MNPLNYSAYISIRKIERTFTYDNTPVLKVSVQYPKVILYKNLSTLRIINSQIQTQVNDFYHYASSDLYQQAIDDYKYKQENGFPFNHYEAMLHYEITYNEHYYLSLYRDQYEYTGGAHGNTVRSSDTWNLKNGHNVLLSEFFSADQDYRAYLIEQITRQADEQMTQNPGIYFENYQALIVQYFNEEHYYLVPDGIAIYYQQYEIAPYSAGIVVFTITMPAMT